MEGEAAISTLEDFAKKCLAAGRHPSDIHTFRLFECDVCTGRAFELTIEHHSGSTVKDFKGIIRGRCTSCGHRKRLFHFTGDHRRRIREEKPVCACGHAGFVVGECERHEGPEGLSGFFDEGVVVGQCGRCGRHQAFIYAD